MVWQRGTTVLRSSQLIFVSVKTINQKLVWIYIWRGRTTILAYTMLARREWAGERERESERKSASETKKDSAQRVCI